jgi:hypothetical protein
MPEWFTVDLVIVVVTSFIAIAALGRLMLLKRYQLLDELQRQAQAAQRKRTNEERQAAHNAANQAV